MPGLSEKVKKETIFIHVEEEQLLDQKAAHFKLQKLDNGKYALKANSDKYLSRCSGCIPGVKEDLKQDGIFTHVEADNPDAVVGPAQFTLERLDFNSTYALKASNGKYLSRCNGCMPGVSEDLKQDSVFAHAEDIVGAAKWTIIILP